MNLVRAQLQRLSPQAIKAFAQSDRRLIRRVVNAATEAILRGATEVRLWSDDPQRFFAIQPMDNANSCTARSGAISKAIRAVGNFLRLRVSSQRLVDRIARLR